MGEGDLRMKAPVVGGCCCAGEAVGGVTRLLALEVVRDAIGERRILWPCWSMSTGSSKGTLYPNTGGSMW